MKNIFRKKRRKELPEFWQHYEGIIKKPLPRLAQDTCFVALDTETTGFNRESDRILALGAVKIINGQIEVGNSLELYAKQQHFNPATVPIHGIINQPKYETLSESELLKQLLDYIGNAPIIAHHAGFDIGMIDAALQRHGLPGLKNKTFDTMDFYKRGLITSNFVDKQRGYSLDEVAEKLNIPLKDRHTAAGDAYITALIFLKLWRKWDKDKTLKTSKLLRLQ